MGVLIILIMLIAGIIPIAIVALIVYAIVKKSKESKGGFETAIRNIYCYIILIITLFAIVIGTIAVFRVGLDVLLPEESTSSYTSAYNNPEREKNEKIVEVFSTLSLVITCIPIFMYHNKITKEIREEQKKEQGNNFTQE